MSYLQSAVCKAHRKNANSKAHRSQQNGRELNIHDNAFEYGFRQHFADELEELEVVLVYMRIGRRVQLTRTGEAEKTQFRIEDLLESELEELLEDAILVDACLV